MNFKEKNDDIVIGNVGSTLNWIRPVLDSIRDCSYAQYSL